MDAEASLVWSCGGWAASSAAVSCPWLPARLLLGACTGGNVSAPELLQFRLPMKGGCE